MIYTVEIESMALPEKIQWILDEGVEEVTYCFYFQRGEKSSFSGHPDTWYQGELPDFDPISITINYGSYEVVVNPPILEEVEEELYDLALKLIEENS